MLDMDGTLLDLAFDNYMWKELVPAEYARHHRLPRPAARERLYAEYGKATGRLDWYCLDHWSKLTGLDILGLHRRAHARIGWLPGARRFLEAVARLPIRVLLVSNSHPDTLAVKTEVTGVAGYVDGVYLSHDFGYAKEEDGFWKALEAREHFDANRVLFVDDTETVLESAERYGLRNLVAIMRPDSSAPPRKGSRFHSVDGVVELI